MTEVPISQACDINPAKPKLAGLPDETPILFVPMAAVDEVSGTVSDIQTRNLGEVRQKSYRSFQPDDVIFAKITPCMENGKSAVVPEIPSGIGFGSTEFHVLRPKPGVVPRYIWHFVRQDRFRRQAREAMTGTVGQERVPPSFLADAHIPLPTDNEQRQIADVLDSALGSCRSADSHLEMAQKALERFRRAVLAAACAGRLTADWREAHPPVQCADDLVASISLKRRERLGRRFKESASLLQGQPELPETWCWTTVGALVDVATGATPLRKRADYYSGTIPWVTSGAVNDGIVTEAREFITERAIKETNAKLFPSGTLLVAMYGEGQTRGRVAELGISAATNQAVAALLFDETNESLRSYLRVFFLENYERIRLLSFGGVQPNLSLGVIRDTIVPLPPSDEQVEIVRRIHDLTAVMDEVGARVARCLRQVDRTSQAVLSKAFHGDLFGSGG